MCVYIYIYILYIYIGVNHNTAAASYLKEETESTCQSNPGSAV